MAAMRLRKSLRTMALVLAVGPALGACLGFGGDDGEEAPPPPSTSLMTGSASKNQRQALPGQAKPTTWNDAMAAQAAANAPKGPLDKSPTAFPAPAQADLPQLPGLAPPGQAQGQALPMLPGAVPQAPLPGQPLGQPQAQAKVQPPGQPTGQPTAQSTGQPTGQPTAQPAAQLAAAPAQPAQPKIAPLPAGVRISAESAPILDVFRREKFGQLLSRADDLYAERSAQLALEYTQDGGARGWINPETGTTGTIRPTRTFQQADGNYCREFAQDIQIRQKSADVKAQSQAQGRFACRLASGRWKFAP